MAVTICINIRQLWKEINTENHVLIYAGAVIEIREIENEITEIKLIGLSTVKFKHKKNWYQLKIKDWTIELEDLKTKNKLIIQLNKQGHSGLIYLDKLYENGTYYNELLITDLAILLRAYFKLKPKPKNIQNILTLSLILNENLEITRVYVGGLSRE